MKYRLYYNRSEDIPRVWSFDEGTQESEQIVSAFVIDCGCVARSGADFSAPRVSKEVPRVWVEIECDAMTVADDVARFYRYAEA